MQNMSSNLHRLFLFLVNAIYPPKCPLCDVLIPSTINLCNSCSEQVVRLSVDLNFPALTKTWFDRCRAAFAFDGPVKNALHHYKYSERMDLARYFAKELCGVLSGMDRADYILPVPLHPKRLRQRGFNQSALIGKLLAKSTGTKLLLDALLRVRDIPPQVGLERDERLNNVKDAFAIAPKKVSKIKDAKIILLDDIVTTGATINECAKTLITAGAKSVDVVAIARTLN